MRIVLVIFGLGAGGAEKVASGLANHWVRAGNHVSLVTIAARERDFFKLEGKVRRIALGMAGDSTNWRGFIRNNIMRIRRLRDAVLAERPEVVVSFLDSTNVLVLLAMLGSGTPVVVSERIDPREAPTAPVVRLLRRILYRRAAALAVQTCDVASWALGLVRKENLFVIPNGIASPSVPRPAVDGAARRGFTVLSVGRLDRQKGFDLLLDAFARCADTHRDWTLRIIGNGPERIRLSEQASRVGIASRVKLDVTAIDPTAAFVESDLFVLSSRYEGFPNALLEAMSFGLPVISSDCKSGPREIIRDGIDGVLVRPGDTAALAEAMDRLMASEAERMRLAARAAEVSERFDERRIVAMWGELLQKATAPGKLHHIDQVTKAPARSQ